MIKIQRDEHFQNTSQASWRDQSDSNRLAFAPKPNKISGVRILGTGSYLPDRVVTNEQLAQSGCDSDWIDRRTGIRQRHYAADNQDTSDLATEAGLRCLASAGVMPEEVGLIIVATVTPDFMAPSTSAIVQGKLDCTQAATIDINAGCTGFVHAFITGSHFAASGFHKHVLVIGADTISRRCDPNDPKTFPLFGDGAGAVLLTKEDGTEWPGGDYESDVDDAQNFQSQSGVLNYVMGADGSQRQVITMTKSDLPPDQTYLAMEGRKVFKWATQKVAGVIQELLRPTSVSTGDVDLYILHQANARIIDAARDKLGLPESKFFVNIDAVGNTSSASIPIALDQANRAGRLNDASRIVICGFGAGLNWSACLVEGIGLPNAELDS